MLKNSATLPHHRKGMGKAAVIIALDLALARPLDPQRLARP
jgi:hypothetical protein